MAWGCGRDDAAIMPTGRTDRKRTPMKHSATTPLTPEAVADVITTVAQMSLAAKEQLLDELYIEQPVLLGNIVILAKMDMAVQPAKQPSTCCWG